VVVVSVGVFGLLCFEGCGGFYVMCGWCGIAVGGGCRRCVDGVV
jgi:hypothetical protein